MTILDYEPVSTFTVAQLLEALQQRDRHIARLERSVLLLLAVACALAAALLWAVLA